MLFTVAGRVTAVRLVQPMNVSVPMDDRLPSRVTVTNPVQFLKASLPILLIRSISTVSNDMHPRKALLPMEVAVFISILRRLWHFSKALLPISLMASGIWMLSKAVHPLKASLPMTVTDGGRLMVSNRSQRAKVSALTALMLVS